MPGDYRRAAVECDRDWNGTLPGSVGAFEGYLASLPPVIGLGFGGCGEWSAEVDTLIGQVAEITKGITSLLIPTATTTDSITKGDISLSSSHSRTKKARTSKCSFPMLSNSTPLGMAP